MYRVELLRIEAALEAAKGDAAQKRVALATAAGVPLEALANWEFAYAGLDTPPPEISLSLHKVQRSGLLHRLDVRRTLVEYAAADAALRLEIARQYPDLQLAPTYGFEEGFARYTFSAVGDGARVLTRTMKKFEKQAGKLKRKVRDRIRSVNQRGRAIAMASRQKAAGSEERRQKQYRELLRYSRKILNDTRRVMQEVEEMSAKRKKGLRRLIENLSTMADRVRQVVKQTKTRVFEGITQMPGKVVSLFEPHTEIIRKRKASKPTEFGKLVQVQEAENQVITHYEVFDERPSDRELLLSSVEAQIRKLGRVPQLVTADAGFYSQAQERAVQERGVKWVAVPNRNTASGERKKLEKRRWFKKAQRWRTGCEGRISILKRRHGIGRCRYRGLDGMKRWVGLGVLADNLINIGNVLAVSRS